MKKFLKRKKLICEISGKIELVRSDSELRYVINLDINGRIVPLYSKDKSANSITNIVKLENDIIKKICDFMNASDMIILDLDDLVYDTV